MILIKGLDIGNGFCKYEGGKRFASKVRKGRLTKVASGIKTYIRTLPKAQFCQVYCDVG